MKPSNPSISPLRRTLIAATAVLATGSIAVFAQSSSSQGSSSSPGSSSYGSSSGSSSYGSSDSSSRGGMSGTMHSSSSSAGMSSSTSSGKLSWTDRRFVTKAAEDGQDEVQLAQLASQKASNPDVRNYAQQLVEQHQQVNSELMSIANQRNLKLDKDESNSRAYKRLNKASPQDFDREFVAHMIDEHEKDIKLFQKAASDAKDSQVREFASKHVADLQQHLQMAQHLQQSVIPTGEDSTSRSGQSYRGTSDGSSSSTSSMSSTGSTTSAGTGSASYGSGSSSSGSSSTSPSP